MRRLPFLLALSLALTACEDTPEAAPPAFAEVDIPAGQVTLQGKRFGTGPTAVILSNMGDNSPVAWEAFAPQLAERSHTVYTYRFRHDNFSRETVADTIIDLIAVADYARKQGATKVILVGASLGGMATVKAAAPVGAAAIVVLAAPGEIAQFDYRITDAELAVNCPKLFITAELDATVPMADSRALHDRAGAPKQWHSYPGAAAHGVQLFAGPHGDDLRQRLTDFIAAAARVSGT